MQPLRQEIERLYALGAEAKNDRSALPSFHLFRDTLTRGEVRAAEHDGANWITNVWVKQGILLGFRLGELEGMDDGPTLSFVDKGTYPTRRFMPNDRVRVVPGGSSVRSGA